MSQNHRSWWVLRLTVEAEVEEAVSTVLWEAGTAGISSGVDHDQVTLTAYFAEPPDLDALRCRIESFLADLQMAGRFFIETEAERLPDHDWLQKWKEGYHSLMVGENFIITPSWERIPNSEGQIVIEIDPGMAFGTGTHASTQLCLRAIEQYWEGGNFLDVGTGTGILAIAAAKLAPEARVVALDIDPLAIDVGRENLARNGVAGTIEMFVGGCESLIGRSFDLIVANLTADIIEEQAAQMKDLLTLDGALVLSGVLTEQEHIVLKQLDQLGLCLVSRLQEEEWVALISFLG